MRPVIHGHRRIEGAGLMDIAADQYLAVAVGSRDRIVIAPVAHQRERADPAGLFRAGFIRSRRQRQQGRPVPHQPLADGLSMTAQPVAPPAPAVLQQ
jgi:hypothetical protein